MTAPANAPRVVVAAGPDEVAALAADLVLAAQDEALARAGAFRVALAGGSTPRRLYETLAASPRARFADWHVFFGDERWVPADDPRSNQRMARESLLDRAGIPARQVHAVDTRAGTPHKAAALYHFALRRALPSSPGRLPCLDLALLGLGADGHTASLFPGSSALTAGPRELAVATWVASQHSWRVTLTAAMLSAARAAVFVVTGADKATALRRVVDGDPADVPPASRIRPAAGQAVFVVDEAAAASLSPDPARGAAAVDGA